MGQLWRWWRKRRRRSLFVPTRDAYVNRQIEQTLVSGRAVVLVYLDIVRLEDLEVRYGEAVISRALETVEETIRELAARFFVGEETLLSVTHIWGDDFLFFVAVPAAVPLADIEKRLLLFQARLEQECAARLSGLLPEPLAFHVGFWRLDRHDVSVDKQLYQAIKWAMKLAKNDQRLPASTIAQHYRAFRDILDNRKIAVVYQPIFSLTTGDIIGWEALTRGPAGTPFATPLALFSFAAEVGELFALERICREEALRQGASLPAGRKLFLNVNPKAFDDPAFVKGYTAELLRRLGLAPCDVVFEITEHEAIDYRKFRRILHHYRSQGYCIAVDDFGAGHANLQAVLEVAPDFLKVDRALVAGVDAHRPKQVVLEAIVAIAQKTGSRVIAEGIERKEELETVVRLGVDGGQGFFLGRPDKGLHAGSAKAREIIRLAVAARRNREGTAWEEAVTLRSLVQPAVKVGPDATGRQVHRLFEQDRFLTSVVVEQDGKVLGLVMRQHFLQQLSTMYGMALYYDRPITKVMNPHPLCVEADETVEAVSNRAMGRSNLTLYDDIVVLDQGRLLGVVTIRDLMERIMQIRVEMAKTENPLTGLPGNVRIERELARHLARGEPFAVMYCDLDRFKQFNDRYGFEAGDRLIVFLANVLRVIVRRCGTADDFLGHIGGDDFVIVTAPERVDQLGRRIARHVQTAMGILRRHAGFAVSVSVAAVVCEPDAECTLLKIAEAAAEVKKLAKQRRGCSYVCKRCAAVCRRPAAWTSG